MTDDEITRRSFVRAVGGAGVAAGPLARSDGTDSESIDAAPSELVVSESAMPAEFEALDVPENPPFVRRLKDADDRFEDASFAVRGYYVGTDPTNPRRLVSSFAAISDTAPPRETVQDVGAASHEQLLEEYRDEVGAQGTASATDRHTEEWSEWRIELSLDRPPYLRDPEFTATEFLDLLRIQYRGRVVLGTVSFGPMDGTLRVDRMLWHADRTQRDQLAAVTGP